MYDWEIAIFEKKEGLKEALGKDAVHLKAVTPVKTLQNLSIFSLMFRRFLSLFRFRW